MLFMFLLYIVCVILIISYFLIKSSSYDTSVPNDCKPIPLADNRSFLIQHAKIFTKSNGNSMLDSIIEQSNKHGSIWKAYVPTKFVTKPLAIIFTWDTDVLQYVLSTGFKKGYFGKSEEGAKQFKEFLGKGIFTSNGERWKNIREFSSSLFHVGSLKQYVDIFDENAKNLFNTIEKMNNNNENEIKENGIDIQDYFMRYTLDSFAEIGFGVKLNSMDDKVNQFAKAFDKVQIHTNNRGKKGPFVWKLQETIVSPSEFIESINYMNNFVNTIIQQRKSDTEEQLKERGDLISRLLVHKESEFSSTEEDLRDFVMNFLIAGRDTTAVLLTWCIYLLSKNESVEQKLLKEFDDVIGNDHPTFANTKNLTYCKQVLQETLRLFPPVPLDGFEAHESCIVPGGYYIEKGSRVIYCAYDLHRRPEIWGKDANEFRPERFDNAPKPYSWIPFHGGPRECLGREMAYLEAKVMLVNILRKYKITEHKDNNVQLKVGIILTAENGMRMNLVPR